MPPDHSDRYRVMQATPEDAEGIVDCRYKAFGKSVLHHHLYPQDQQYYGSEEALRAWDIRTIRGRLGSSTLFFKVVDEEQPGRIVGFARWETPVGSGGNDAPQDSAQSGQIGVTLVTDAPQTESLATDTKDPTPTADQSTDNLPPGINVQLYREYIALRGESRKQLWGENKNYWHLAALAVDPEYQRRGIASMLMKIGLDHADRDGLPVYIVATPEGTALYPRFGFERRLDTPMLGGLHVTTHFIRPPQGSK